jgi:crotonobetainyl-CoA:carnitine CoA-transferase CaiB-like acyl-CoA transferase
VIELGEMTAAPYAAKLFGDYGAEVVKLEAPGQGDPARRDGLHLGDSLDLECSGLFSYLNTNKIGVTLDPGHEYARPIMDRLLRRADILITNFPLVQLAAWDLAPGRLRTEYPSLIVTTITPFGIDGPYAGYLGDELVTAAMGGIVYSTPGMPDAAEDRELEPPLHPGCAIAETVAGLVAAAASMVAVFGRYQTQQGCHVDVAQQAAVAAMQQRDVSMSSYSGTPFDRVLNATVIGRMPNFYLPCKDGYVVIAAFLDHQWRRLVEAMGTPNWALSDEFSSDTSRTANWVALRLHLMDWTMTLSGDELCDLGEKLQLPFFPFYPIRKLVDSEQVRHRSSLEDIIAQGEPRARMPGSPVGMQGTPWKLRRSAPRLGEHTYEVLHEWLNIPDGDIRRLIAAGAV